MKDTQTLKVLKELREFEKLAQVNGSIIGDICKMAITEIERHTDKKPIITQKFIDVIQSKIKGDDMFQTISITLFQWAVIKDILEDHIKQ